MLTFNFDFQNSQKFVHNLQKTPVPSKIPGYVLCKGRFGWLKVTKCLDSGRSYNRRKIDQQKLKSTKIKTGKSFDLQTF